MSQLFLEITILILAVIGIFITLFEILNFKTENKLYYRVINLKNSEGKRIEIIINARDYDKNIEHVIKSAFSAYKVDS